MHRPYLFKGTTTMRYGAYVGNAQYGHTTLIDQRRDSNTPENIALRESAAKAERLRGSVDPNVSMWGAPWPAREE